MQVQPSRNLGAQTVDILGSVVDLLRNALVGQHKPELSDTYDVNSWEVDA